MASSSAADRSPPPKSSVVARGSNRAVRRISSASVAGSSHSRSDSVRASPARASRPARLVCSSSDGGRVGDHERGDAASDQIEARVVAAPGHRHGSSPELAAQAGHPSHQLEPRATARGFLQFAATHPPAAACRRRRASRSPATDRCAAERRRRRTGAPRRRARPRPRPARRARARRRTVVSSGGATKPVWCTATVTRAASAKVSSNRTNCGSACTSTASKYRLTIVAASRSKRGWSGRIVCWMSRRLHTVSAGRGARCLAACSSFTSSSVTSRRPNGKYSRTRIVGLHTVKDGQQRLHPLLHGGERTVAALRQRRQLRDLHAVRHAQVRCERAVDGADDAKAPRERLHERGDAEPVPGAEPDAAIDQDGRGRAKSAGLPHGARYASAGRRAGRARCTISPVCTFHIAA